jgi:hypothetical protein
VLEHLGADDEVDGFGWLPGGAVCDLVDALAGLGVDAVVAGVREEGAHRVVDVAGADLDEVDGVVGGVAGDVVVGGGVHRARGPCSG